MRLYAKFKEFIGENRLENDDMLKVTVTNWFFFDEEIEKLVLVYNIRFWFAFAWFL